MHCPGAPWLRTEVGAEVNVVDGMSISNVRAGEVGGDKGVSVPLGVVAGVRVNVGNGTDVGIGVAAGSRTLAVVRVGVNVAVAEARVVGAPWAIARTIKAVITPERPQLLFILLSSLVEAADLWTSTTH